jgi:hypothetical protein
MNLTELDALIYEVIVDANGEDEQLWAFRQAFEDALSLPADAFVIGEPVAVITFDYDGNERRGPTARCRREDGSGPVVAAAERFPRTQICLAIWPPILSGWASILIRPEVPHPRAHTRYVSEFFLQDLQEVALRKVHLEDGASWSSHGYDSARTGIVKETRFSGANVWNLGHHALEVADLFKNANVATEEMDIQFQAPPRSRRSSSSVPEAPTSVKLISRPSTASTARYFCVVASDSCPSQAWTVRTSIPGRNQRGATRSRNLWRCHSFASRPAAFAICLQRSCRCRADSDS